LSQTSLEDTQQSHNYNLRPRATKINAKYTMYNMTQTGKAHTQNLPNLTYM